MKYSNFEGMLAWSGGTTLMRRGTSIDDDHPLVSERPELFDNEAPEAQVPTGPTVERATRAPGEVRVTPSTGPAATNRVPKGGSGR